MSTEAPFSVMLSVWTAQYLRALVDVEKTYTDEEIERLTRIAFVAARTTLILSNAMEESAKTKLS